MGNQNQQRGNAQPAKNVQPATQGKSNEASQQNGAAVTESSEREAGLRDFIRTIKKFHQSKKVVAKLPKAISEPALKGIDLEIQKVIAIAQQWVTQQIKDALTDDES